MPFSAHDLRYHLEDYYASLYAYLHHRAQRYLGPLAFDAFEVDQVVGHVIEQLARFHVLGGGDAAPKTALDNLTPAQFYAFLNRSAKNKAIDRLRKYRSPTNTLTELEKSGGHEEDSNPMSDVVESLWGTIPFATPEEAALAAASQQALRHLLKQCIEKLSVAPHQLQAVIQELEEIGAEELAQAVRQEFAALIDDAPLAHVSQHKDHAHKKLRHCLQQSSSNLGVLVALRLSEYGVHATATNEITVHIQTLVRDNLSEKEVQTGLQHLVAEGLLDWDGEETIRLTSSQCKRLARFYEGE